MDMQLMYGGNGVTAGGGGSPVTGVGGTYWRLIHGYSYGVNNGLLSQPGLDVLPACLPNGLPNIDLSYLWPWRKKTKSVSKVECKVCSITLNSETQAKQHFNGKNHLRKLKQMGLIPNDEENEDSKDASEKPSSSKEGKDGQHVEEKDKGSDKDSSADTSEETDTGANEVKAEGEEENNTEEEDKVQGRESGEEKDDTDREGSATPRSGRSSSVSPAPSVSSDNPDDHSIHEKEDVRNVDDPVIGDNARDEEKADNYKEQTSPSLENMEKITGGSIGRASFATSAQNERTHTSTLSTTSSISHMKPWVQGASHVGVKTGTSNVQYGPSSSHLYSQSLAQLRAGQGLGNRQTSLLGTPSPALLEQSALATPSYFMQAGTGTPRLSFPTAMGAQPTVPVLPYQTNTTPTQLSQNNMQMYANFSNPTPDTTGAALAQNRLYYGQLMAGGSTGFQQQLMVQQSVMSIPGAVNGLSPGLSPGGVSGLSSNAISGLSGCRLNGLAPAKVPQPALPSRVNSAKVILPQTSRTPDHRETASKLDPVSQAIYDNFVGNLPTKRKMDVPTSYGDNVYKQEVEQRYSGLAQVKRVKTVADVNGSSPMLYTHTGTYS